MANTKVQYTVLKFDNWRISSAGSRLSVFGILITVAVCLLFSLPSFAEPKTWRDDRNGYAIGGFDPLSYHVSGNPERGRSNYEYAWNGRIWSFANVGNKNVFQRHPEIYSPGFGGYDPYALSNQTLTRGQPTVWTLYKGKVLLFYSAYNRRLWLENETLYFNEARVFWSSTR